MPTVLRKFGYRFHFYSNEGREPPHVHITGKGGEMKVWLPKIIGVIKENTKLFMEAWNEFSGKKK